MPIVNKSVTMLGASVRVTSFTIYPQPDGTYRAAVNGTVTDGGQFLDQLEATASYGSGVAVLNNMAAAALTLLRTQNGFET
jgi:hypothetical protein